MIALTPVSEVAADLVARGISPEYVAGNYSSNAAAMRDRLARIIAKGEGSKVAGYTREMCERSIIVATDRAVSVPAAMRALTEK